MLRQLLISIFIGSVAATSLWAQNPPLSLCIVQTKPDESTRYDPSAGPWAIGMYDRLVGQTLRNGSPLQITVLPASVRKDVLPEVQRLRCAWVVQLWYSHVDFTPNSGGVSSSNFVTPLDPQLEGRGRPFGREDNLFFSLWNGVTQKVLAQGAAPLRAARQPGLREPPNLTPFDSLAKQILKRLNQLR